ncbi:MAG: GNAT family N-acetyltransferase [Deltaproteobacteria bacterium]|nr:GNAT family N-acetyltransferase [Deltaproteobacteria bacterium]
MRSKSFFASGNGIGQKLFDAAVQWAKDKMCKELKVETQNINFGANKFYKKQGCRISAIERSAYETHPNEVKLVWSLML